jgi:iron complex outermembrane receptor protein
LRREAYQSNIRIDWEFGEGYTFTSLTAFHSNKIQNILDLNYRDGRQFPNPLSFIAGFPFGRDDLRPDWNTTLLNQSEQEDFSQELRVTSPQDARLRWTAGFNYFDAYSPGGTVYGNLFIGPFFTATIIERDVSTPAVFGAVYYDIRDNLTLGVEARWQRDEIKEHVVVTSQSLPPPPDAEYFSAEFESFAPRVSLNYNYADNSTLYGLFSRGYRPGRFNTALATASDETLEVLAAVCPACQLEVEEEQLDNYEIGIKSTWLDGRARTTISIYYDEWINGQVANSIPVFVNGTANLIGVTLNNGAAKLKGLEFEGQWAATDNFTLSGSLGYNDTELTSYVCGDCNLNYGSFGGVEGNELPSAPSITYTLSGQYNNSLNLKSMSGNWDWFGRFDFAHQGSRKVDYSNVAETAAYDNLNVRLGIRSEAITIEAFVLNATDNDEFLAGFLGVDLFTFGAGPSQMNEFRVGVPVPRSWGVRGTYRF